MFFVVFSLGSGLFALLLGLQAIRAAVAHREFIDRMIRETRDY